MRTAQISKAKFPEAIAFAKEVSGYVEKKFGSPKIGVWLDTFGELGTLRWTLDMPDLAAVEKLWGQALADADYWKMLERARTAELFIDGRTIDTVSRAV
jgi:hypothetical protein